MVLTTTATHVAANPCPSQGLTAEYMTILRGSPRLWAREKLLRMASSRIPEGQEQRAYIPPSHLKNSSPTPIGLTPHPLSAGPFLLPGVGPHVP